MTWRRAGAHPVAVATIAIVVAGASCREVLGVDERSAARCDGGFGDGDCGACVAGSCCAEVAACEEDAECGGLLACIAACDVGDTPCRTSCRQAHPNALAPAAELLACTASSCAAECDLACGGYLFPSDACAACGVASCCAPAAACMEDASCITLGACQRACGAEDFGCLADCGRAHRDAAPASRDLGACVSEECAACGDPAWACLGSVTWPDAPRRTITVRLRLRDYFTSGTPVVGALVRACGRSDFACSAPLAADATTSETGQATFALPAPFEGYFEASTADVHALIFPGPPALIVDADLEQAVGTDQAIGALAAGVAPIDTTLGAIAGQVRDCASSPAGGVRLDLDPLPATAARFYFQGGLPSFSAPATDAQGAGGFLNLTPLTSIAVVATVDASGEVVGQVPLFVRAGYTSYFVVVPAPR